MSSLRKYTFNMGAAGGGDDVRPLDVSGPVLAVLEATAAFQVSCDGEAPIPCERGMKFRRPFNKIQLENLSTSANVVVLLIGDGEVEDYRPQSRPTGPSRAKTLWNTVVGAASLVAATAPLVEVADPTRAWLFVRALTANTGIVLLKASQSGADTDFFANLGPGQFERFPWTGAIYLRAQVAADNVAIYGQYY